MRYDPTVQAAMSNPLGWVLLLLLLGVLLTVGAAAVLGALALAAPLRAPDTRSGLLPWLGSARR